MNSKTRMQNSEQNITPINFYQYLISYFAFLSIPIFIEFFFRYSLSFLSTLIFREIFIGIFLYISFLFFNKYSIGRFSPKYALMEILLPVAPVMYFRGRLFGTKYPGDYPKWLFKMAVSLSSMILLLMLAVSVASLTYKPLFAAITNGGTLSLAYLTPKQIPQNYSIYIIEHNTSFMVLLIFGSIFLYIPAFAANYINSAVLIPAITGAAATGNLAYILPNAILELSGTIVASATGFVFLFYAFEMMRLGKDFLRKRPESQQLLHLIIMGIVISFVSFLLAWPIEVTLLTSDVTHMALQYAWFKYTYFIDSYLVVASIWAFIQFFERKFISPLTLFNLFFYASVYVFILNITAFNINVGSTYLYIFSAIVIFAFLSTLGTHGSSLVNLDLKHEPQLESDGITQFQYMIARGKSMEPSISSGDIVILGSQINLEDIKKGDIITYRSRPMDFPLNAAGLVTHRVISAEGDKFQTKGDNLTRSDPAINGGQIIGKVVARIMSSGRNVMVLEPLTENEKTKRALYTLAVSLQSGNLFPRLRFRIISSWLIYLIIAVLASTAVYFF